MNFKRNFPVWDKGFRLLSLVLALVLGMGLTIGLSTALANSRNGKFTPSASLHVNTTQDNPDSNPGDNNCDDGTGHCSLRAAIEESNALSGEDSIFLPANTYIISGQLTITDSLIIYGEEALTTIIDADSNSRVLSVTESGSINPISVSLFSLTIQNGNTGDSGGGIWNNATLVISDSIIGQNTAANQAGGIHTVTGTLTIINSAIISNTSELDGSGLYAFNSVVTVTNSTISGNATNTGRGGGIYSEASQISLTNATLANNTATYSAGASGGGIYIQSGLVSAVNTIIAGNFDESSGEQHPDCSGILISNGHDLIQDMDGCIINGTLTGVLTNTIPLLGPLADHGGSTLTHALLENSPAINQANPAYCPITDQRGFNRRNGYCDMGTFEAQPANLIAVSGSRQRTQINTPFQLPLQASVQDEYKNALAGVLLTFAGPPSGPGISNSGEIITTNVAGATSFTPVANGTQGSYTVTASTDALITEYRLTNLISSTTRIISDLPDPSPINQPFLISFTVTSTFGVPGGIVTVTVSNSDETCIGELANGMGDCTFSLPETGEYTLLATYAGSEQYAESSASEVHTVNAKIFLPLAMKNYAPPSIFGIEFQNITPGGGLTQISAAQPTWVRKNGVLWSLVSPGNAAERQWDNLAGLEGELHNAAFSNMETILIVRSTPGWAQKNPGVYCGPIKADAFDEFATFLTDLVKRYSAAPYHVKYWELWNEPDVDPAVVHATVQYGCWGDPADPYYGGSYYTEMLKVAYPAIKAADPDAKVLVGGLLLGCDPRNPPAGETCVSSKFLEGILASGGEPYFDGISFHAYDYYDGALGQYSNDGWDTAWDTTGTVTIAKTDYIVDLLDQYHVSNKFLMNTETAILYSNGEGDVNYEQTKAYYLAQSYAAALSKNLLANVWFSATGWRASGLLDTQLNPLPAYHAYAFARSKLGNSTFAPPILNYNVDSDPNADIIAYSFQHGNRQIWLVWSVDGGTYTLTLPETPSAAYDVFGNSLPISGDTFDVSVAPTYLEWMK